MWGKGKNVLKWWGEVILKANWMTCRNTEEDGQQVFGVKTDATGCTLNVTVGSLQTCIAKVSDPSCPCSWMAIQVHWLFDWCSRHECYCHPSVAFLLSHNWFLTWHTNFLQQIILLKDCWCNVHKFSTAIYVPDWVLEGWLFTKISITFFLNVGSTTDI